MAAGPGQDGVALLRVVPQQVRQVLDLAAYRDPAVGRLIVLGQLRRREVAARPAHGHFVLVPIVRQVHLGQSRAEGTGCTHKIETPEP